MGMKSGETALVSTLPTVFGDAANIAEDMALGADNTAADGGGVLQCSSWRLVALRRHRRGGRYRT